MPLATGPNREKAMPKTHRVNVNFSESAYKTLEDLADRKGKTLSEVLRDAIALEKWFQDTNDEGGKVLVEQEGRAREVIPR
jgi:Ribbon-helix-helix protein, copG family